MKDRKQEKLGVYTKNHGFLTVPVFEEFQNKPLFDNDGKQTKPVQVSAVQYRRLNKRA